jgi:L-2-hydroxyglutarate oxidase
VAARAGEVVDVAVIGGGIIGLAVAHRLLAAAPELSLVLLEKESRLAAHQTGHNSGVIHSGIYYRPGSLKATTAVRGRRGLIDFCAAHGVRHEICGKVIVATNAGERGRLELLAGRARENGVAAELIDRTRLRELEPHVEGVTALHVSDAGIVDFPGVCDVLAALVSAGGGEIRLSSPVTAISEDGDGITLETPRAALRSRTLVNCAGLHSDRVAAMAGARPSSPLDDVRIVPFRGEYYDLVAGRRRLIRNLVYPVPDPAFPFLGVHFTRMIDGRVHAGPNAVLALSREGYRWAAVRPGDTWEALRHPGLRRLARRHARMGLREIYRSLSKPAFVRALQRLVPEIRAGDLVRAEAGVRAQALRADGTLVDDFAFANSARAVHVVNAPSPAATAALEIGRLLAARVLERHAALR